MATNVYLLLVQASGKHSWLQSLVLVILLSAHSLAAIFRLHVVALKRVWFWNAKYQ